jgi:hypothetical protein
MHRIALHEFNRTLCEKFYLRHHSSLYVEIKADRIRLPGNFAILSESLTILPEKENQKSFITMISLKGSYRILGWLLSIHSNPLENVCIAKGETEACLCHSV